VAKKAYARRYAQAIFEIALEKNELERWQSDLKTIAESVGNAFFLAAMESNRLKIGDKNRLMSEVLGDVSPMALNLVRLLIDRSGVDMVGKIAKEYQELLYNYSGIAAADVITAVPLDEKEKQKLTESLGKLVGKKVVIESRVDPEIIGGVIARVGGKLLDGSTRSKLQALKKELAGARG
jgi:F-type H+-transporting ATPase subunit delta